MQSDQPIQSQATSFLSRRSLLKGSAAIATAAAGSSIGLFNVTAAAAALPGSTGAILHSHEDMPGGV
jgi:hypothetical protein